MPADFFIFWAGLAIGVFVHEAGHAVIGDWLELEPRTVSIGIGPILLKWRWRLAWVQIRLLPLAGFVSVMDLPRDRRCAVALFLLGGVIGNVALFAVLAGLSGLGLVSDAVLKPLGMAQLFLIAINLLPLRGTLLGFPVDSDGRQLFRLLFRRATSGARW